MCRLGCGGREQGRQVAAQPMLLHQYYLLVGAPGSAIPTWSADKILLLISLLRWLLECGGSCGGGCVSAAAA